MVWCKIVKDYTQMVTGYAGGKMMDGVQDNDSDYISA